MSFVVENKRSEMFTSLVKSSTHYSAPSEWSNITRASTRCCFNQSSHTQEELE